MKITVEIPDHKYNIHIKKGLLADVHNYVDLNRKVLADMAVNDAAGFQKLAEIAKEKAA